MTSRPSGGPAAKPGGFFAQAGYDSNSRMSKPSTAGNTAAKPTVPNMHKQPVGLGVNSLQGAIASRNKSKVS